jgi:hypothetical protein
MAPMNPRQKQACMPAHGPAMLLLALAAAAIAVTHLLYTPWANLYLYDGDSLVLALLEKSLRAGEAFQWTLSSQMFLFPEGLLYLISRALAPSIKAAFVINTVINVALLFYLFYFLALSIFREKSKSAFFALSAMCVVLFYMLCEPRPDPNRAFVTFYLLNTYYYGVIVAALTLLLIYSALIQQTSGGNALETLKNRVLLIVAMLITALTYFSNPLLLLQFSAPLLAAALLMFLCKKLRPMEFGLIAGTQAIGLAAGYAARIVCSNHVGNTVASYFHFDNIVGSARAFAAMLQGSVRHVGSALEYAAMAGILALAIFMAAYLARQGKTGASAPRQSTDSVVLLLVLFAIASAAGTFLGVSLTGNTQLRYLLPVALFPVLAFIAVVHASNKIDYSRLAAIPAGLIIAVLVIYLPVSTARADRPGIFAASPDVDCYNHYMAELPFNAVGGFWTSRALDLYSNAGTRVLQIGGGLHHRLWMNNNAPYFTLAFNGVIVDKPQNGARKADSNYIESIQPLGPPAKIFRCKAYDIYYYADGSDGFKRLNQLIKE